ncbi:hypothetical protein DFJ74DRAFT_645282 [Hyaloraphidium curvatum]|nr:hypothetical protein DFJ74DRAFT_645282 [Hyaloraphidium curvatum]
MPWQKPVPRGRNSPRRCGPGDSREAFRPVEAAGTRAIQAFNAAWEALRLLTDPELRPDAEWRAAHGGVPRGRAPDKAAAQAALDVFRRGWPAVRGALADHVGLRSAGRRAAWGAVDASAGQPWIKEPANPSWPSASTQYNNAFGSPMRMALYVLSSLAKLSRPVRRRVAETPALLDDLALAMLHAPPFWERCAVVDHIGGLQALESISEQELSEALAQLGTDSAAALVLCVIENPKPWAARCRVAGKVDELCPAPLFAGNLRPMCFHLAVLNRWTEETVAGLEAALWMVDAICSLVLGMDNSGRHGAGLREEQKLIIRGAITDTCDRCGAEGEKLLRCSGCKVTRYCGVGCQRAAWTDHKVVCKEWS